MVIDEESFNRSLLMPEDAAPKLGLMVAKIALYNFEWRFRTLVMFNSLYMMGLQTFLMNYNKGVIVKMGRFVPAHRVLIPQFVIFGEETSEVSSTIRWLINKKYDSNARFIIICASHNQECDEQKIFQTLLGSFVLNAVLLKTSPSNLSKEPSAYSYQIVSPGKCFNDIPYKVDLTSDCYKDECYEELYPERLTNFYKCRLGMSTVEHPPFMYLHNGTSKPSGTDGDIIKLAADMLNATLVIKTPTDGTDAGHYTGNDWTGSLGDIYNGRVHASVCTVPLTANKYGNFQISFTYYSMDMVWVAKLPTERPPWEKLLHPLNFRVRITILFMFIGIIFMNIIKDSNLWFKVRRTLHMGPPKYNLLFYSWLLFLGMPIRRISRKKTLRLILFTWIWCCFVLRCGYQAALVTSLKQADYQYRFKNFREVLRDGYPYGGLGSVRDYYQDDRSIYENWKLVNLEDLYTTLDEILDGKTDFVLASNKEIVIHRLMTYNGKKRLQILPEKIVNSPTVVYLRKYSPLTSPLSYVLRIALEAGFVQRSYERYLDRDKDILRRLKIQRAEALSLNNFAGCFVVLIIGWFLSAIYFAVEVICGNLNEE